MARTTFKVGKIGDKYPSYEVACLIPDCWYKSTGWDYRNNALAVGYKHFGVSHVSLGEPVHYARHCSNEELRTTDNTGSRSYE